MFHDSEMSVMFKMTFRYRQGLNRDPCNRHIISRLSREPFLCLNAWCSFFYYYRLFGIDLGIFSHSARFRIEQKQTFKFHRYATKDAQRQ